MLPFYSNVCELTVIGLQSLIECYLNYLSEEKQFVDLYEILVSNM